MPIPESQLETWSKQGAVVTAQATHESLRNALAGELAIPPSDYEVYLQGSYKNTTNIRGDSDVDLVVQYNKAWIADTSHLSAAQRELYRQDHTKATYGWNEFRSDLLQALRDYYGWRMVSEGNKSLKVAGSSGRLNADVVVCLQHRKYLYYTSVDQDYIEGIVFFTSKERRRVLNYPKLHYANGAAKNGSGRTKGRYKAVVRVFKNARSYLVDRGMISKDVAPSYFLECFLYNVPDSKFEYRLQDTFFNTIDWLVQALQQALDTGTLGRFVCQNEELPLFGDIPEQWAVDRALILLRALIDLSKNWG